jgi:hypothetical protein
MPTMSGTEAQMRSRAAFLMRCRKQTPSSPDWKHIAQNRQKKSRSRASLLSGAEHIHRSESSTASQPSFSETEATELPSTKIALLLLEVYFKRIYNAALLFNKSIAYQLYMQNDIPGYLLRAIFAQAAIFLKQVDSQYKQHIKIVL